MLPHPAVGTFSAVSSHWSLFRFLLTRVKVELSAALIFFFFKASTGAESGRRTAFPDRSRMASSASVLVSETLLDTQHAIQLLILLVLFKKQNKT